MKLWEAILCPSIIQKRIVLYVSSYFCIPHSKLYSYLKKIDKYLFRDYFPIHPTGLFYYEEDDSLLLPVFASQSFVYLLPELNCFRNMVYFDDRLGERWKRMIMKFYKRGIQKHLYVFGDGKIYVAKSPFHTSKMDSLQKTFPGIRFICLIREPEQVIPSTIALLTRLSKIYCACQDVRIIRERVLQVINYWYNYPLKIFSELQDEYYKIINFKDLVGHPEVVINDIYAHFGFILDKEREQELFKEIMNASAYRSGLVYSLDHDGLDPETIRSRYQNVFEELIKLSAHGNRQKEHVPFPLVKDR